MTWSESQLTALRSSLQGDARASKPMRFGVHALLSMEEVLFNEPGYCVWALQQDDQHMGAQLSNFVQWLQGYVEMRGGRLHVKPCGAPRSADVQKGPGEESSAARNRRAATRGPQQDSAAGGPTPAAAPAPAATPAPEFTKGPGPAAQVVFAARLLLGSSTETIEQARASLRVAMANDAAHIDVLLTALLPLLDN